jgi:hypothetical protein
LTKNANPKGIYPGEESRKGTNNGCSIGEEEEEEEEEEE